MSKPPQEDIVLPEPPTNSYLHSEILTYAKKDFYGKTWTLKYRSWVMRTIRDGSGRSEEYLAYCFYTPTGEAKLARVVTLDSEDKACDEMFRYFSWWIFSYDSRIIEVDLEPVEKEELTPEVVTLKGRKISGKKVS